MTKTITSLDQLKPGMTILVDTHHVTERYTVGMHDKGRNEWSVLIDNLFHQSSMTLKYNKERMSSIFLNQEVEVPE